ncbi:peptidylprolyl isomerase [Pseudoalteromonas xiamenensis]
MLEKIREGSQGVVVKIILGLVILSFALAGIGGYLGRTTEQPVAEVNGVVIGQSDFARAFENERARLEQQFGEYFNQIAQDPNYMAQVRQGVVERLVQQELQTQLAKELGLRISDEKVKQTILEMPYFQMGGEFSNDRYLQVIRQMNYQPDSFREFLREDMTRSQLVQAVAGTDFVLENEVKSAMALEMQTRKVNYAILGKSTVVDTMSVSDDEVKDYYDLNQNLFQSEEQVAVEYIELSANDVQLASAPSEEDVKAYYEEQKSHYSEPERRRVAHILIDNSEDDAKAKEKAEAILARLNAGEDFAKLAETESSDVVSAEVGGDLDWIEKDMMDPAFEEAAFALTNKGDISGIVKSEFGYHIIKLTDLQQGKVKALADVHDELLAELERNAKVDAFYQKQTAIAEKAFEIADSLLDASEAAGVEVKKLPLMAKSALPEPLNNAAVTRVLATPEILEDRVNSEIVEVGPEHIVVVRIADYKPATTKPLDDVKDTIVKRLKTEKASTEVKAQADALYAKIQAGEAFEAVVSQANLDVKAEDALARRSYSVAPAIVKEAFKLPHPTESSKPVAVVELASGDAALVQLVAVNPVSVEEALNEQQSKNFEMAQANKNYITLLEALKAQADVKFVKVAAASQE